MDVDARYFIGSKSHEFIDLLSCPQEKARKHQVQNTLQDKYNVILSWSWMSLGTDYCLFIICLGEEIGNFRLLYFHFSVISERPLTEEFFANSQKILACLNLVFYSNFCMTVHWCHWPPASCRNDISF